MGSQHAARDRRVELPSYGPRGLSPHSASQPRFKPHVQAVHGCLKRLQTLLPSDSALLVDGQMQTALQLVAELSSLAARGKWRKPQVQHTLILAARLVHARSSQAGDAHVIRMATAQALAALVEHQVPYAVRGMPVGELAFMAHHAGLICNAELHPVHQRPNPPSRDQADRGADITDRRGTGVRGLLSLALGQDGGMEACVVAGLQAAVANQDPGEGPTVWSVLRLLKAAARCGWELPADVVAALLASCWVAGPGQPSGHGDSKDALPLPRGLMGADLSLLSTFIRALAELRHMPPEAWVRAWYAATLPKLQQLATLLQTDAASRPDLQAAYGDLRTLGDVCYGIERLGLATRCPPDAAWRDALYGAVLRCCPALGAQPGQHSLQLPPPAVVLNKKRQHGRAANSLPDADSAVQPDAPESRAHWYPARAIVDLLRAVAALLAAELGTLSQGHGPGLAVGGDEAAPRQQPSQGSHADGYFRVVHVSLDPQPRARDGGRVQSMRGAAGVSLAARSARSGDPQARCAAAAAAALLGTPQMRVGASAGPARPCRDPRLGSGALPPELPAAFEAASAQLLRSFTPGDLHDLVAGLVHRLGHRPNPAWWAALQAALPLSHLAVAPPYVIAGLLGAMSAAQYRPSRRWLAGLQQATLNRLAADFSPPRLAAVITALGALRVSPHPDWLAAWMAATRPQLSAWDVDACCEVMGALGVLHIQPPAEFLLALQLRVCAAASGGAGSSTSMLTPLQAGLCVWLAARPGWTLHSPLWQLIYDQVLAPGCHHGGAPHSALLPWHLTCSTIYSLAQLRTCPATPRQVRALLAHAAGLLPAPAPPGGPLPRTPGTVLSDPPQASLPQRSLSTGLVLILFAVSRARWKPPDGWAPRWLAALLPLVPELPEGELRLLLKALSGGVGLEGSELDVLQPGRDVLEALGPQLQRHPLLRVRSLRPSAPLAAQVAAVAITVPEQVPVPAAVTSVQRKELLLQPPPRRAVVLRVVPPLPLASPPPRRRRAKANPKWRAWQQHVRKSYVIKRAARRNLRTLLLQLDGVLRLAGLPGVAAGG